MIPLPVILIEFMAAFGLALFLANGAAVLRLRREDNWPPTRPAAAGAPDARVPSRGRILTGLVIGLLVALWAVASFVGKGYHF